MRLHRLPQRPHLLQERLDGGRIDAAQNAAYRGPVGLDPVAQPLAASIERLARPGNQPPQRILILRVILRDASLDHRVGHDGHVLIPCCCRSRCITHRSLLCVCGCGFSDHPPCGTDSALGSMKNVSESFSTSPARSNMSRFSAHASLIASLLSSDFVRMKRPGSCSTLFR